MSTASGSTTNKPTPSMLFRIQVAAITVVGAAAVILFIISKVVDGDLAATLNDVAGILGIVCAVIGLSFAVTAGSATKRPKTSS